MVASARCLKRSRELLCETCSLPLTSWGRTWLAVSPLPPSGDFQAWAVGSGGCGHPAAPGECSHLALAPAATSLLEFQRRAPCGCGCSWSRRARGQCAGWLPGLGTTTVPPEPISRGAGCVCTLCCPGRFASRVMPQMSMCRAHSRAPVWILVHAITSPCALQKVECERCPSLGFVTPEGLRLMRKSCPHKFLGPSLPTQALLSCPEQQAPALLPVVLFIAGHRKVLPVGS